MKKNIYLKGYIIADLKDETFRLIEGPVLLTEVRLIKRAIEKCGRFKVLVGSQEKLYQTKRLSNKLDILAIIK